VRAQRRYRELSAKGITISETEVLAQLRERDRRDTGRAHAPLHCADDAIVIDSSALSVEEVVQRMREHISKQARSFEGLKPA
jgi:cytidylate kinase